MNPTDEATIEAARIAASAAIHAAWIQWTAGIVAILGAIAGGAAAYKGATRQVRLQEEQAKARSEAYRFKLSIIVDDLYAAAAVERSEAKIQLDRYRASGPPELLTAMPFSVPEELTPGNWSHHAMLGIAEVRGIHQLYEALKEAIRFNSEMRGKGWSEVSIEATFARTEPRPDGGVDVVADVAVEQHFEVAENLFSAVKNLRALLSGAPDGSAAVGRKEAYDVAVRMYKREHDRWVQNALFLFGALASIFVAARELREFLPLWVILGLATLISAMSVFVATSIRVSTDAWRETVLQMERSGEETGRAFESFASAQANIGYWSDLARTIFDWRTRNLFSVTRIYARLGIILTGLFAFLTYRAIACGWSW